MSQAPFERSVFLDTDIHCCSGVEELFTMLDRYDLGAVHACLAGDNSQTPSRSGLPADQPAFYIPQLNSGVIAYKLNKRVRKFFSEWAGRMVEQMPENGQYFSDQTIWEGVLAMSKVRHTTLTAEYNCRIGVPQKLHGTVKLLHGRPSNGWDTYVKMINMNHGYRIYFPNIGIVALDQGYFRLNRDTPESMHNVSFRDFSRNVNTRGESAVEINPAYAILK